MIDTRIFWFLIPGVLCSAYGSILLKKGSEKFSISPFKLNFKLIAGISLFGMSILLYLPALSLADLSVIYPLSSLTYVLIAILSVKHLGENMNNLKWIGIFLIVIGSYLIVK